MEKDEKQVNFNCPAKLLEEFDEKIKGHYGDRTDAITEAMRLLLATLKEASA
jgi:metal-responsive CopG/Arc/MetJ family transcriptional regulator